MRIYLFAILIVLSAISVSAAYDLAQTGYWIPSYYKITGDKGTAALKSIGQNNQFTSNADFRKSIFRPITRVITGPSLAWNTKVPTMADTGSGLYTPYTKYSGNMMLKDIDTRARGGPNPYVGVYGIERQAVQTYNVPEQNFGMGTGASVSGKQYIKPGIPNMIRSTPQYVNAGLPASVSGESVSTPVAQ